MTKKTSQPLIYKPKALIPGYKIEAGLEGFYVGVPDRGYKDHPFTIKYTYPKTGSNGEMIFVLIEKIVADWNRADRFRRFMDKWGRGAYTLAYFKVTDTL